MNMVQSQPIKAPRALEEARRKRVVKPPDERRSEILQAATQLFRERGFETTTVQAIASKAGVAAGTVYLYYPSKEALLGALVDDFEAGLVERFAEIAEDVLNEEDATGEIASYQEVVERLIDGIVAYSVERRVECEVLARGARGAGIAPSEQVLGGRLTELLARVIQEGVRLGYISTSDPEMSAYLLNAAAIAAIGQVIASGDDEMLERVVRGVKELYIKGLAPDPIGASG